ncbi:MAG: response regulator [Desulfofustis sp.]|nr:response regulator [Desulfofustis sp.]
MTDKPAKIMVIEDEVLIGLMLVRKLRTFGYEVAGPVTSGEEAIKRLEDERPEVILMDITLAGKMNGIEAGQIIKTKYAIPIIIFSGYDDSFFPQQVRELAPVAVLKKMGPVSAIAAAIKKALDAC